MGGNAMKTRPIARSEYVLIKQKIINLLPELVLVGVQEALKDYYGDIDIYHHPLLHLDTLVQLQLNHPPSKRNGPTLSINYEGVQIDFHTCSHPVFATFFFHCGWSILLCPFIRPHDILIREDGLWTKDEFLLSDDPTSVLAYLGIDSHDYNSMRTEEEVLTTFCTSWLYQPSILNTCKLRVLFRSLMKRLHFSRPPASVSIPPQVSPIDWFGKRSSYDAMIKTREEAEKAAELHRLRRKQMIDFLQESGYEGMELSEKVKFAMNHK